MKGKQQVIKLLNQFRSQVADPVPVDQWLKTIDPLLVDPEDGSPARDWENLSETLDRYHQQVTEQDLWKGIGCLYRLSEWYLSRGIEDIKGIGPKRVEKLARLDIESLQDLAEHYPRAYTDRRFVDSIRDLEENKEATILGEVLAGGTVRGRRPRYEVRLSDDTDVIQVNFWNQEYLKDKINRGMELFCSGRVESFRGTHQMNNPDYEIIETDEDLESSQTIKPIYPLTEGITQYRMREWTEAALKEIDPILIDTLPHWLRQQCELISYPRAMREIHQPEDIEQLDSARRRLIFEEFFFYQLLFVLQSWKIEQTPKDRQYEKRNWMDDFINKLPFTLTSDQSDALDTMVEDLLRDRPMHRLLQGDVGTGKTVIAIASMLRVAENGYQTALMAPTEVLAEQHYETIQERFGPLPCEVELLMGSTPDSKKEEIRQRIQNGELLFVVGTHALIQDDLLFSELGYVVIDEQHRFGVEQRKNLREKGPDVDMLVMSATPIPRSLALTVHGDLEVTTLEEFPTGPKQIETHVLKQVDANRKNIYTRIRKRIQQGERAFFVFPAIEDNEETELTAAQDAYEKALDSSFFDGVKMGLLHGRMNREEKQTEMKRFRDGDIQLLFSTTVVEVGIDVPEASFLVVHDAERFGLAQLHQLRGRVGRGGQEADCYLFYSPGSSPDSIERLEVLERTLDGFEVARADLRHRGIGDLTGTRQSGAAWFELGDIWRDKNLMDEARKRARQLIEKTDGLRDPHAELIRQKLDYDYAEERQYISIG